jgi:hypothetical protein
MRSIDMDVEMSSSPQNSTAGTRKPLMPDGIRLSELDTQNLPIDDDELVSCVVQRPRITNQCLLRLLQADVVANALFSMGGLFFVAFAGRELTECCGGPGLVADTLYMMGSTSSLLSGVIQLMIDVAWTRSIPFGRYTANKRLNVFITLLLMAGVILDFIAFLYWRQGGGDAEMIAHERYLQWFSTHLLFLASIIVMATKLEIPSTLEDRLDVIASTVFVIQSMINICARYVTDISPEEGNTFDITEVRLEFAATIFWTCNGFLNVTGGRIRLRKFLQSNGQP